MKHCLKPKRKLEAMVSVSDDWYPNFPGNKVDVSFHHGGRISVWGDDDFGMEKDGCSREEYETMIRQTLSQESLRLLGFKQA